MESMGSRFHLTIPLWQKTSPPPLKSENSKNFETTSHCYRFPRHLRVSKDFFFAATEFMRLEAQAKAGFYPTPSKVVDIIKTGFGDKMPGPRRLLDPCCGTGEPAAQIAAAAGCDAYGVEINTDRAKTAKNRLSKRVAGNLFSVRARPGAFSILYLNPPYDFDAEDGRTELSFLKH